MSDLEWVKDLVRAEQQMEASDMVDFSIGFDPQKTLHDHTASYLDELKENFVNSSVIFNQMKGVSVGNIKIYGIANTLNDFMLFRNGFKLLFTMKKPGTIGIRFQHSGSFFPSTTTAPAENPAGATSGQEDIIEAQWGAFGEVFWTHQNLKINPDFLVRYFLTHFIRESAK